MNLYNKKYLYANGSSVTVGGGFESEVHRPVTDVRQFYYDKGIIPPPTDVECSYPRFMSDILGLEMINDAWSGSGIDRLVRRTTDWILNNQDKLDETIIILEPQTGIRLDWWVNEWQDYGVLNAHKTIKGDYPFTLVKEWFRDDPRGQINWNQKYEPIISPYLKNFFDWDVQYKSEMDKLVLFVSFLNQLKIDYLISIPSYIPPTHTEILNKIIPFENNLYNKLGTCIWEYARNQKLLIKDEVESNDNHIGLFGNRKMAKIICEFIKSTKKVTYYSPSSSELPEGLVKNMFKNKSLEFVRLAESNNADFIVLDDLLVFESDKYLKNNKEDELKELIKIKYGDIRYTKNILIILYHERVFQENFILFVDFLNRNYQIDKSQIFYVDSSISNHFYVNNSPLEFKLRMYSTPGLINVESNNSRTTKVTILNRKLDNSRLFVLDRFINEYDDIDLLRKENTVTAVESQQLNHWLIVNKEFFKQYFKCGIEKIKKLKFPWKLEDIEPNLDDKDIDSFYTFVTNLHSKSIISIVSETRCHEFTYPDYDYTKSYQLTKDIQFSEKSLLPIFAETMVFFIMDGIFYKKLESIGFNFSYLKTVFDINYLTNTQQENIEAVSKISKYVKNKTINELNKIRLENIKHLSNNKKIISDLFFGDFTKNELEFFEKLSKRKLTK